MTTEKATRRYFFVLIPAVLVLLAASAATRLAGDAALMPPALYVLALVPVAAMLTMFWAQWRYVTEIDEFLRSIQVKAAFVGLACVMTIATGWGFLELSANVPPLSVFWLNPLYWIVYSVAAVVLTRRYGAVP